MTNKKTSLTIFLFAVLFCLPHLSSAHGGHDDLIIRLTKQGFEPNEMAVFEGDTILFINNDDKERQPTFDSTKEYDPEFDSKEAIIPSSSWKFTFTKVGTWHIADKLNSQAKATIVVLKDPNKSIESQITPIGTSSGATAPSLFSRIKSFLGRVFHAIGSIFKIRSNSASNGQAENVDLKLLKEFKSQDERAKYTWLDNIAETKDPKVAWQYVKAAYNTPAGVVGNPHDMAHEVGRLIFQKYGLDGLSICDASFAFGCYHGLMERAFFGNNPKDYKDNLLKASEACKGVGAVDSPEYWSCIHGMGHGIATFREYKLDPALNDCNILSENLQTYCQDGVFMELSINAPKSFYKESDPIYPCDSVGQKYKIACARSQVQVMRLRFSMNTGEIARACVKTNNQDIIFHCVDALGYFIGQTASGNASEIVNGCAEIEDEAAAAQCTAAAAGELVFQNSANWKDTVKSICSKLDKEFQASCDKRVNSVAKSYGRN
jgi:plastocyanin